MRQPKRWLEILSVLGLFLGIALVILQLRQNEELIRYQIATELRVNQDNARNTIKGEQFSTTLAKLQSSPAEMTDAELIEFDAHARTVVSELDLRRSLANAGIFKGDWTTWLETESCMLFDNPVGQSWLAVESQNSDWPLDQEMLEELNVRLEECEDHASFLKAVNEIYPDRGE